MKLRIGSSFILIFLLCISGFAQLNDAVSWSDKYEEEGFYKLLGETEDALFAERKYDSRFNSRSADVELIRYDKNMELTHAVEVRDLEKGSYSSMGSINTPEGVAHIYFQTTKSGKQIVSAQIFSHEDLRKTEIVDLTTFKIKTSSNQKVTDMGLGLPYSIYPMDYILSQDKSLLGLIYTQEKVGKSKESYYQYAVFDLFDGFKLLHNGDFYSDDKSNRYTINDIDLSNTGALNYLLKHYVRNSDTEHINRKPAYSFEVHHLTGDSTEYIYDIKKKGIFIDRLKLGSDDDGSVYVAGYLRKQPLGDILSNYVLSLDPEGNKRAEIRDKYRPREIEDMQGKEDDKLNEGFRILDVIVGTDLVYLVKQYVRRNSRNINNNFNTGAGFGRRNNNFGNVDYDWDFDEVVIEGVGKRSGEVQWITTNPRRQRDNNVDIRYFITGSYHLLNDNLYLIYNERLDNVERLVERKKLKTTDVPGDTTMPMIAKIDKEGKITYRFVNGEKRYHIPNTGVLIGQNDIYMINQRRDFDEFYLGVSGINLLDF